jgi:SAM-dependent methyltransferase
MQPDPKERDGATTPFFDQFDRFYSTSRTSPWPERLHARYQAIIQENLDLLRGQRVLDVASHDGRWSFAALKAGCAHVTGMEAREHLVLNARATFEHYGVDRAKYEFVLGDVFTSLKEREYRADTVLLLGFFYHVNRHVELAALISDVGARHIILDTAVVRAESCPREAPIIELSTESSADEGAAIAATARVIVGRPSRQAIRLIFGEFGFTVREVDWTGYKKDVPALNDYWTGNRSTFVLSRKL